MQKVNQITLPKYLILLINLQQKTKISTQTIQTIFTLISVINLYIVILIYQIIIQGITGIRTYSQTPFWAPKNPRNPLSNK